MFRTGGTPNEGIMHGLVNRRGYSNAGTVQRAKDLSTGYSDILRELVPAPKPRFNMGQMGLNIISGKYAGDGLLRNIAGSAQDPYAEWTKADDARRDYDRQLRTAAAQTGVKHAMEVSTKDPKYSNTMRMVEEAIRLGKYPNTLEGRQTAWDEISRSASDWINKSYQQRFEEAKDDLIKQGYTGPDLNMRAEYEAKIAPALAEAGISYTEMGGILPRNTKGSKGPKFSKMKVGQVYYDLKDGQVKRYKGQDEATGKYLLDPIEI